MGLLNIYNRLKESGKQPAMYIDLRQNMSICTRSEHSEKMTILHVSCV